MPFTEKDIDVICQHTRDRKIIPLRIRLQDEDGEFHTYNVKSYKDRCCSEACKLPNGMMVTRGTWLFEASIVVFEKIQCVRLCYHAIENRWTLLK